MGGGVGISTFGPRKTRRARVYKRGVEGTELQPSPQPCLLTFLPSLTGQGQGKNVTPLKRKGGPIKPGNGVGAVSVAGSVPVRESTSPVCSPGCRACSAVIHARERERVGPYRHRSRRAQTGDAHPDGLGGVVQDRARGQRHPQLAQVAAQERCPILRVLEVQRQALESAARGRRAACRRRRSSRAPGAS